MHLTRACSRPLYSIWRAVAEDFLPFDVDVTTEDLGYPAVTLARAAIGGNSSWYIGGMAGAAYLNGYGRAYYQPAMVFSANMGGDPKVRQAAAAAAGCGHLWGPPVFQSAPSPPSTPSMQRVWESTSHEL